MVGWEGLGFRLEGFWAGFRVKCSFMARREDVGV